MKKPSSFPAAFRFLLSALVMTVVLLPFWLTSDGEPVSAARKKEGAPSGVDPATRYRVLENLSKLPLAFEANGGQWSDDVLYGARAGRYQLLLSSDRAILRYAATGGEPTKASSIVESVSEQLVLGGLGSKKPDAASPSPATPVELRFAGARDDVRLEGVDPLIAKSNYLLGDDPSGWVTEVETFRRVAYRNLYPGVDLVFYGKGSEVEYDFKVYPAGDPSSIRLRFAGVDRVEIDEGGDLLLHTSAGVLRQRRPEIYQEAGGAPTPVEGRFVVTASGEVGFEVEDYDRELALVIDPVIVASYLGGMEEDRGFGIALDNDGNIYVTGRTMSANFPIVGAANPSLAGDFDGFVTKLNSSATQILYSTYFGGTSADSPFSVAVDSQGAAYMTGFTLSQNFPTTPGAFQRTYRGGDTDGFLTKLNPQGNQLVFSTFLGGSSGIEAGRDLLLDAAGVICIVGFTQSANFPTTQNAAQRISGGGQDATVSIFSADGSRLIYSTFLGGSDDEVGLGIAVGGGGDLYISGRTTSTDFPVTSNAFQTTYQGGEDDAFLVRLNGFPEQPDFATYVGGSGVDLGTTVFVGSGEVVFLAGFTDSADFPAVDLPNMPPVDQANDIFFWQFEFQPSETSLGKDASALSPPQVGMYPGPPPPPDEPRTPKKKAPKARSAKIKWRGMPVRRKGKDQVIRGTQTEAEIALAGQSELIGDDPDPGPSCLEGADNAGIWRFRAGQDLFFDCMARLGQPFASVATIGETFYAVGNTTVTNLDTTPNAVQTQNLGEFDAFIVADGPAGSVATGVESKTVADLGWNTATISGLGIGAENISADAGGFFSEVSTATGSLAFMAPLSPGAIDVNFFQNALRPFPVSIYCDTNLSNYEFDSLVGPACMTPYDQQLRQVSENRVNAIVFPGFEVEFQKVSGNWITVNPEQQAFQLEERADTFVLGDISGLRWSFMMPSPFGHLFRVEDPNANALNVNRAEADRILVSDTFGRELTMGLTAGRLSSFTQLGLTYNINYQTLGDGKSYPSRAWRGSEALPLAEINWFQGNLARPLIQDWRISGRLGLNYTYTNNRVTGISDGQGQPTTIEYNGLETIVTKPSGASTSYFQASNGNTVRLRNSLSFEYKWEYDRNNNIASETSPSGTRTNWEKDQDGNLIADQDGNEKETTFNYTRFTQGIFRYWKPRNVFFADFTDPNGSLQFGRDQRGNTTSFVNRIGRGYNFSPAQNGLLDRWENPSGGVGTQIFNPRGLKTSITTPDGTETTAQWGPLGGTFSRGGRTWGGAVRYEPRGREFSWGNVEGNPLTVGVLDVPGLVTNFQGADRKQFLLTYNFTGRLTQSNDFAGNSAINFYNQDGDLVAARNALRETLEFGRDSEGNITGISDATGRFGTYQRNPDGIAFLATDGLGNGFRWDPDRNGNMVRKNVGGRILHNYSYNDLNQFTGWSNTEGDRLDVTLGANGLAERVAWSDLNLAIDVIWGDSRELKGIFDPNRAYWRWDSDNMGRTTGRTDPLGNGAEYVYEGISPRRIRFGARLNFDSAELGNGEARQDAEESLEFSYDAFGRLAQRLYSDGTDIRYRYDENHQLLEAQGIKFGFDVNRRMVNSNGILMTRDDAGRIATITYAAGKTVTYEYQAPGRLKSITDWMGGVTTFFYDAARRPSAITRPSGVATRFELDFASRLTSISETGENVRASISLTRTPGGRITRAIRDLPQAALFGPGESTAGVDAASQVDNFEYDVQGRLLRDDRNSYQWSVAPHLLSIAGAVNIGFDYDALGLMTRGEREYVWNYALRLPSIEVERRGGVDERYYVHLPNGMLLYSVDARDNTRHWYHYDEMGNTVMLTNDAGRVTDAYGITPYGEVVSRRGSTRNPFIYQGMYGVVRIAGSSLYSMRARFYDARTQRFISRDPVITLDPRSVNPYEYAKANPLLYVDPTGLSPRSTLIDREGSSPITPIDRQLMETLPKSGFNLFELAGTVPGVSIEQQGTFAHRYVDFTTRSISPAIGFDEIGRVEVLRGPQGSLFGAFQTGGVTNAIFRQPIEFSDATLEKNESEQFGSLEFSPEFFNPYAAGSSLTTGTPVTPGNFGTDFIAPVRLKQFFGSPFDSKFGTGCPDLPPGPQIGTDPAQGSGKSILDTISFPLVIC